MSFYLRPSLITLTSDEFENGAPLILSDMSRQPVKLDVDRIETRERMASGRMRSKFVADKHTIDLDWEFLPSRTVVQGVNVVSDGYANASDLKRFYMAVKGEFSVKMYADNGSGPSIDVDGMYDEYFCFFGSFSSTIEKRGTNFDIHKVSMTLEEA
jgi:hypothetical protein